MENDDGAVYCKCCKIFLNGQEQYNDHVLGKKHRKNYTRTSRHTDVEVAQHGLPERVSIPRRGQQVLEQHVMVVSGRHLTTLQYDEFSTLYDLDQLFRPYALTVFHGLLEHPHPDLLLRVLFERLEGAVNVVSLG